MINERPVLPLAYDWCDAWPTALGVAQQEGCPILLVVAPPWCAFSKNFLERILQDPEVMELLENFVLVYLDPDLDPEAAAIWQKVVSHLTEDHGPPLVLFLSPEGLPFLGGGYFSDQPTPTKPTFAALLKGVQEIWAERPVQVSAEAKTLWGAITTPTRPVPQGLAERLHAAYTSLREGFDPKNGGFEETPKFPRPGLLRFLLAHAQSEQDPEALAMLTKTLDQMARGGIWDQLGGGFHRASRDRLWIVPYFEKLLPLNAQMTLLYAEAAEATGFARYLEITRKTSDFLCNELLDSSGLFWSGLAADKDYYGWTSEELIQCVPREHVQAIALRFHLTPHHSKHVLYAALEPSKMYQYTYEAEEVLVERIRIASEHMLRSRQMRLPPPTVRRFITSWNALAIEALLTSSRVTRDPSYAEVALRTLDRLEALSSARAGYAHVLSSESSQPLLLEDAASMGLAHLAAYSSGRIGSLEHASEIAKGMIETFFNDTHMIYSSTEHLQFSRLGASRLQRLEDSDLAPSPIALALRLLVGLCECTHDPYWMHQAERGKDQIGGELGLDHGTLLLALHNSQNTLHRR